MIKILSDTIKYILTIYKSSTHINTLVYSVKLYHGDRYTDRQIDFVIKRMVLGGKITINKNYIELI